MKLGWIRLPAYMDLFLSCCWYPVEMNTTALLVRRGTYRGLPNRIDDTIGHRTRTSRTHGETNKCKSVIFKENCQLGCFDWNLNNLQC